MKSNRQFVGYRGRHGGGGGGGGDDRKGNPHLPEFTGKHDRVCCWCSKVIKGQALEKPLECPHCRTRLPLRLTQGAWRRCVRCDLFTNVNFCYCVCGRPNEEAIAKLQRSQAAKSMEPQRASSGPCYQPTVAVGCSSRQGPAILASARPSAAAAAVAPIEPVVPADPASGYPAQGPLLPVSRDAEAASMRRLVLEELRREWREQQRKNNEIFLREQEAERQREALNAEMLSMQREKEAFEEERMLCIVERDHAQNQLQQLQLQLQQQQQLQLQQQQQQQQQLQLQQQQQIELELQEQQDRNVEKMKEISVEEEADMLHDEDDDDI